MFGLLKTAFGFGTGISWIVYAVVFGLGLAAGTAGAAWVQQLRIDAVQARLDGKDDQIKAANVIADSATERANTNFIAAKECAAQVEQDKTSIALQNDATEKLRASINDMERVAVHLETEKAQLLQTLEDRTAATEAEAKAHPDQVVPVGSIVRARTGGLWE